MVGATHSDEKLVAQEMLDYINSSPTPFHAVDVTKKLLLDSGFSQLLEKDSWSLSQGGKYFFTRNSSSIVTFAVGKKYSVGEGFCIIAAHTDSPCLKLKPISKVSKGGFLQVGVQTYGGGLWHTWFDRDLSLAGRVVVKQESVENAHGEAPFSQKLIRIHKPILRIPTLAIHLNRDVNSAGFKFNDQAHLLPVLATVIRDELNKPSCNSADTNDPGKANATSEQTPSHHTLLVKWIADELKCESDAICDFELCLFDTQEGRMGGLLDEFVFSSRLDNLCMSFCSIKSLISSTSAQSSLDEETGIRMVCLFDNEEIGSNSAYGAQSPLILDAIKRISFNFSPSSYPTNHDLIERCIQKSFLVSADMAHCLHPNYMEKHEENHQPKIHKGLTIKVNANQRYATTSITSFLFKEIARKHGIPIQEFVVRNDMPCGSTIGPILASGLGIRTVDVGIAQLSMHSIREMCGVDDVKHACNHFTRFFLDFSSLDSRLQFE